MSDEVSYCKLGLTDNNKLMNFPMVKYAETWTQLREKNLEIIGTEDGLQDSHSRRCGVEIGTKDAEKMTRMKRKTVSSKEPRAWQPKTEKRIVELYISRGHSFLHRFYRS